MLLRPDRLVEHVTDINLEELWAHGIRGFIFDLDNTIMAPHSGVLDDGVAGWLRKIEGMGFKSVVVSNNPLTFYTQEAEKVLNIPVIGNAAKPRRKQLYRALKILELDAHQVVVVGDRPLTDIWGGQRLGAKTILVDPLTKHKENGFIRLLRKLERVFIHPECSNDVPLSANPPE